MGTDFKHHCAFLGEELQVLWKLGVIITKGGICVMVGQSLGCNSCGLHHRAGARLEGAIGRRGLLETIPM